MTLKIKGSTFAPAAEAKVYHDDLVDNTRSYLKKTVGDSIGNESGAWDGNETANMSNAASALGFNFGGGGGYYPG